MRRLALLLVILALAPLACGGDGSLNDVGFEADVAEAATRTAEAGSARVSYKGVVEGGRADGASFTGDGEFAGRRARIRMDVSELVEASEAEGAFDGEVEMVFDGTTMYMRWPGQLTEQLFGGRPWLKMELGGEDEAELGDFLAFSRGDPSRLLRELAEAADFDEAGVDEVRGVETRHYRGTLDSNEIDVWVGGDGLLRRVSFKGPLPAGEDSTETTTMEFFDFGAKIDINLPPGDQVAEFNADSLQGG